MINIVYCRKNQKFLLLRSNNKYTTIINNIFEKNLIAKDIFEKIDLFPIKIINNNSFNLIIINSDKINYSEYLWCNIDEFIKKLDLADNFKKELNKEIENLNITPENIDLTYLPYGKVVEVYILNEKKEFVIVFSALKGKFCKILSGHVEKDESFKDAAIREVKEELNLDIDIIGISKYSFKYDTPKESIFNNFFKSRGGKGKSIIARLRYNNQEIKIQEEEISSYKWIKKEDIEKYLIKEDQIDHCRKIFEEFKDLF